MRDENEDGLGGKEEGRFREKRGKDVPAVVSLRHDGEERVNFVEIARESKSATPRLMAYISSRVVNCLTISVISSFGSIAGLEVTGSASPIKPSSFLRNSCSAEGAVAI